jgi:hypothetical protein
MAPVVGSVTHDPIKARRRLEQAWAASAITVARLCRIHRRRCCRRHSLLSSPLPNAAVVFSASVIAAVAASATVAAAAAVAAAVAIATFVAIAVAIAVAAATTIAATAAVADCYVFVTPTP